MEIVYIPDTEFVLYIKGFGDKARLEGIDGHFRWIITRDDGTEYIARPLSSKHEPDSTEVSN